MKDFLSPAISVVLLVGLLIAGIWYAAVDSTDTKWKLRLATADHKIDSLLTIRHIPVPPETVRVAVPVKPLPGEYARIVDSAFAAGVSAGMDSIRNLFRYVSQPLDTAVFFSHGDTLLAIYKPLAHQAAFTLNPAPVELRILTIHDSVLVPLPSTDSERWWELPAAFGTGALVAVLAILAAK